MRTPPFVAALLVSLLLVSCMTTRNNAFVPVDSAVSARQYDRAARLVDGPLGEDLYGERDQVLRYLDSGLLHHLAGEAEAATRQLNLAEQLIQDNYTKSVTNAAASFLINDYSLDYGGEVYEDLYLNVFKALDYIRLGLNDDAFVEINRLNTKLNLLEDKANALADSLNRSPDAKGAVRAGKTQFHNSALARFVSLLLYRADGSADNAELDLNQLRAAFATQPELYRFPVPALDQVTDPRASRLTVMGFTGRSPIKRANTLRLSTGNGAVNVQAEVEDARGRMVPVFSTTVRVPGVKSGYNFKAQTPDMVLVPSQVASIQVYVDGQGVGSLDLLERMDTIAVDTFSLTKEPIFFKTVLRTVAKGLVAEAAKTKSSQLAANTGNSMLNLLSKAGNLATDALVDASEQADLRSGRFFPGQAWVGDFAVPPGDHSVVIEYRGAGGQVLFRDVTPHKTVSAGGLHVVDSYLFQ